MNLWLNLRTESTGFWKAGGWVHKLAVIRNNAALESWRRQFRCGAKITSEKISRGINKAQGLSSTKRVERKSLSYENLRIRGQPSIMLTKYHGILHLPSRRAVEWDKASRPFGRRSHNCIQSLESHLSKAADDIISAQFAANGKWLKYQIWIPVLTAEKVPQGTR